MLALPRAPKTDCHLPMNKPSTVQVSLKLPFVELAGTWVPDEAERNAAWEMHVELIARVAVVELAPDEGSLREALNALYSLFPSTREIFAPVRPRGRQPSQGRDLSFGAVLNQGLRPVLTKWHPELAAYEATRPPNVSRSSMNAPGQPISNSAREWPPCVNASANTRVRSARPSACPS